jgi:hypothetical protein
LLLDSGVAAVVVLEAAGEAAEAVKVLTANGQITALVGHTIFVLVPWRETDEA